MSDMTDWIIEVLRVEQAKRYGQFSSEWTTHVTEKIEAELPKLTPFWAIADGEGGISEECFDQLDCAEELLADWLDSGYAKAHLVTTSFTGWSVWTGDES